MKAIVYPSILFGAARAPASKSHFIRLVAAAMLAEGGSKIFYPSSCEDAKSMLNVAWQMGAEFKLTDDFLDIHGNPIFRGRKLFNCGESGLAARLMLGIATLCKEEVIICGTGTLLQRQLGDIDKPLRQLGVKCVLNNMMLPAKIYGPATGGQVVVDGSESSQFVSGLLMALPLLRSDTELIVKNLKSRPYIDLTLETLNAFGIEIQNSGYKRFHIKGNQSYKPVNIQVEGDWSGGAFLLVAAALNNNIKVTGLDANSLQADKAILTALERAGAFVHEENSVFSVDADKLKAFTFDATHCPDLFPPLAVLAANCKGISIIKGVSRLKHKESNRGTALMEELGKLNIMIAIEEDEMFVTGGPISGGTMSSRNDHRMAMAGAVAALSASGKVEIGLAESVSKSWPDFFRDIGMIGGKIEFEDTFEDKLL
jgi:3-phosphoshikimate 1-carboxyvinyltransferase